MVGRTDRDIVEYCHKPVEAVVVIANAARYL